MFHSRGGSGVNHLKEELVGHCTLSVLSLIGFAIYSLTYSLVYATKEGMAVVACLEMWMVTSHLVISLLSTGIQGMGVAVLRIREPLPHVASAQTSLFLGIATTTTIIGILCLNEPKKYAAAFFGAAAFPQLSAVGTFAWAWVMYVSSLGAQTWSGGGFTMGLTDYGCLCASTTIMLTPLSIISKLRVTCDPIRENRVLRSLCKNDKVILCGGSWLALALLFGGLVVYALGFFLQASIKNPMFVLMGMIIRIFGILLVLICSFVYLASTNDSGDLFGVSALICTILCLVSLLDNLLYKRWRVTSAAATTASKKKMNATATTTAQFDRAAMFWRRASPSVS